MAKVKIKVTVGMLLIVVIALASVFCIFPQKASAGVQNQQTFYQGYVDYTDDELHNYTKRTSPSSQSPSITVLVHGQGGNASHWSNDGNGNFEYDSNALVSTLSEVSGSKIYKAQVKKIHEDCKLDCESHFYRTSGNNVDYYQCNTFCERSFVLFEQETVSNDTEQTISFKQSQINKIKKFDQPIIIVFEASQSIISDNIRICGGNDSTHDVAYKELELVIDTILADYKFVTGMIPKINLISHSRGGILSMMYAIEHPYNVDSLISMGTPYNGSLFGTSQWIVNGLGLSNAINCPSGQDIMSEDKQKQLRNDWNEMIKNTPDANINAVAIGSKTRLSFIAGLLEYGYLDDRLDQFAFLNEFLGALTEFTGAAIATLHENHPIISDAIFQCANIVVDIAQLFKDDFTAEQIEVLQEIIYNCEIAYGDLVIKDDMFINYDSQTASGYDNIKTITRVFDKNNACYDLTSVNDVPIPHNLEARDPENIQSIFIHMNYGSNGKNYSADTYNNKFQVALNKNEFAKIEFNPTFSGLYTITTQTNVNKVVLDGNGNILSNSNVSNIQIDCVKGGAYYLYLGSVNENMAISVDVDITLLDLLQANGQEVVGGQSLTFAKTYNIDTIKSISFNSNLEVNVYTEDECIATAYNGNVDVLFEESKTYFFEIVNNKSESVILSVNVNDVNQLGLGQQQETELYPNKRFYSYTSNSNAEYTFSLQWTDNSALLNLVFYNQNLHLKNVTMAVNQPRNRIYRFYMNANEKVYFGVSNDNVAVCNANISVQNYVSEYSWRMDGETIENNLLKLQRNGVYSGVLEFCYNDQPLSGYISTSEYSSSYLSVNNSKIAVKSNTPLTYGDYGVLYANWSVNEDLEYSHKLRIAVLPKTGILLSTSNSLDYQINIYNVDRQTFGSYKERVTVAVKVTNYTGVSRNLSFSFDSGTSSYYNKLTEMTGYYCSKEIDVRTYSVSYYYNNHSVTYSVDDNPELFNNSSVTLYGYFSGGSGANDTPYLISNLTELKNIEKTSTYDSYNECYRIRSSFRLMSDISLQGNWTPIKGIFMGTFYGNRHIIKNLTISISKSGNYGLFEQVGYDGGGLVEYLYFENVKINNTITDDMYVETYGNDKITCVGVLAGINEGDITNCTVNYGDINVTLHSSWVGGIVGFSMIGEVYNSDNKGVSISGYGILGGIVGINGMSGSIRLCYNYANVTYTYYKESGCAAGIVGKNNYNGTIKACRNAGTIGYGGNYALNSNNRPCMAQIVGWNTSGTLSGNTCAGKCDFKNMTLGQKKYCKDGEVGRTGE